MRQQPASQEARDARSRRLPLVRTSHLGPLAMVFLGCNANRRLTRVSATTTAFSRTTVSMDATCGGGRAVIPADVCVLPEQI